MNALGTLDWIGLALLVALWLGYSVWRAGRRRTRRSLMTSLARYRRGVDARGYAPREQVTTSRSPAA